MDFNKVIDGMAERWSSPVVARKELGKFTGGILSGRTAANFDCKGTGIPGRFTLLSQTCYPVENVVEWLKTKAAKDWKSRNVGDRS